MFIIKFILLALLSVNVLAASNDDLAKKCLNKDMDSCVTLTAQFLKASKWAEAFEIGEALCKQNILKGCTYGGAASISKGEAKVGFDMLSKACDGFEPYACQFLADIAKKNREDKMRYMYQKRACYFGLGESCKNLNKPATLYTGKGQEFLKLILSDCEDTNSATCKSQLENLSKCEAPLTKEDCYFIPGDLSIVFRAKLIQNVGKLNLMKLHESEGEYKKSNKRYTYNLTALDLPASTYVLGFQISCTKKYEDKKSQSTSLGVHTASYDNYSAQTKRTLIKFFKKEKGSDCFDPTAAYEAYAVGKLDPLNPTKLDIWKINRDGDLIQVQDGLP